VQQPDIFDDLCARRVKAQIRANVQTVEGMNACGA
jgi:hypothetical protein